MGDGGSRCPRCAAELPADARFCPACGFAAARLSPGDVLDGKYEILDKLAEGGMGEVYRARHIHLEEIRVIKVTKPDTAGEIAEPRRFQEEARLATLVRHPNVAALYDFSRLPDGSFYGVWEFIDGETLEQWLRRHGPMPAARAIDVAGQVLSGLSEIHRQGIVHRDLSPDNVMLREGPGGRLQAKIIDLGIAKRVASASLARTGTGMFLGKLKYCSPEQAGTLRAGEKLDARSDLYSFGAVLYEMLTGRPPFEAETPEGYLGQHLNAAAPPLDTSRLPREVGAGLASITQRALQKSRDRRFRTADEFRDALEALRPAAESAEPEPAPNPRASSRFLPAAAILLVVAAAIAGAALLRRRPAPPAAVAIPTASAAVRDTAIPEPAGSPEPRAVEGIGSSRGSSRSVADPSEAGRAPTSAPPPRTAVPAAATPLAAEDGSEPPPEVPSRMDAEGARRFRRFLERWRGMPPERQSNEARLVARLANRFVDAYPDDPLAGELRQRLPASMAAEARRELQAGRTRIATRFYEAYRELDFAPSDAALDRLFASRPATN